MANAQAGSAGLTSARIRRYHHRIVLQALRRLGEASKADLARAADLTNTAVGQIVEELQDFGLIDTVGKRYEGQRGQPATMLRLNESGAFGIGVRLDRTRIETALVDLSGTILKRFDHDGPLPSPTVGLRLIADDIATLKQIADSISPGKVAGVGLARPFNLGAWLGKLGLEATNLPLWDTIHVAAELARLTGLSIHEENDGTAAAIGEAYHGHGHREADFAYFFIGPAIGGGVILDGDYRSGPSGNAGDVAMMPVLPSNLPSAARNGGRDILLSRASVSSLVRHLKFRGHDEPKLQDIPSMRDHAPAAVSEWRKDCVEALVDPILATAALLDVPMVVLDGDLGTVILEEIIADLQLALDTMAPEARKPPRILRGSFGSTAGALGAASLPLFIHFAPRAQVLTKPETASRGVEYAPR